MNYIRLDMKPPYQHKRIDLAELKAEIVKHLGPEGSKQYFHYLSRFLNLKLSKVEFNKLCLRIVGRENISLHNQFVHSILRNACNAKAPPPKESLKFVNKQSEPKHSVLSNGDIHDHKLLNNTSSDVILENGDLSKKLVQHHQVLTKDSEDRRDTSDRSLLQGQHIIGGPRKTMPLANSAFCGASSFSINGLLDSSALRERMEKVALMQGLKGVTMDCAGLLNKGLDLYLKRLISSGVELVGPRLGSSEPTESYTNKQQASLKLINGVTQGNHHQHKPGDSKQEKKPFCPVSLLDFKVAMELNPQQLGEDWPLQLEKICTHAFGEE